MSGGISTAYHKRAQRRCNRHIDKRRWLRDILMGRSHTDQLAVLGAETVVWEISHDRLVPGLGAE
jgi:hypothetical protein